MLLRCRLQVPSPASRWGSSGGSSRIRSVGLHLVVGCSRPLHLCLLTSATAAALVDPALSHRLLRSSPRASPLCSSALCAVVRPRPRSIGERVKEGGKGGKPLLSSLSSLRSLSLPPLCPLPPPAPPSPFAVSTAVQQSLLLQPEAGRLQSLRTATSKRLPASSHPPLASSH